MSQSEGKIFLAAQRGHTETECFRSYNTFNFGTYQQEHKKPFGPLYVLNDETIAGGRSALFSVDDDTLVLLLPLVGGIVAHTPQGESPFVHAGQVHSFFLEAGQEFTVRNPFDAELVNYLQFWLKCPAVAPQMTGVFSFDIEEKRNCLVPIFPNDESGFYVQAAAGKFEGRQEGAYHLTSRENGVMVFVVQGAFEVENRLLEERDGLALWETGRVELEALSNDAIILLLEVRLVQPNSTPEGSFSFGFDEQPFQ